MKNKVKLAILGPGRHADLRLAPALSLSPSAELWSVLSRDQSKAEDFARRHQARAPVSAYTDLNVFLSDPELDGVIIASPDKLHEEQAIAVANAGKHCLVEKPLATSTESCSKMLVSARDSGICLAVAYHLRWHQGHRGIHRLIQGGQIGKIRHIRAQWTWKAEDGQNWRATPEVGKWWSLGGVGTHCLDLIRWMMVEICGEVDTVKSLITSSVWGSPHDETAILALRFESGATAEICSSVLFESPSSLEIYGEQGYYICKDTFGYTGAGNIWTNTGNYEFNVQNPFIGEIEDFVRALSTKTAPEVDAEEGLRNVDILCNAT